MDARARTVSEILHEPGHYIVPLFQRSYSWHKEHWQRLNGDVMALADDAERQVHFLGPLVCTHGRSVPGCMPAYQLIDGQQRLTTLTVALAAIRDVERGNNTEPHRRTGSPVVPALAATGFRHSLCRGTG